MLLAAQFLEAGGLGGGGGGVLLPPLRCAGGIYDIVEITMVIIL